MKRAELIFGAILVPIDYLVLVAAGLAAYYLRFDSTITDIRPVVYEMPWLEFFYVILVTSLVMVIIFAFSGLYVISGTRRITTEIKKIISGCTLGVMLVIVAVFFQRELFSSRFIILAAWILSMGFVMLARILFIYIERFLFTKGIGVHRIVLIGEDKTTKTIKKAIEKHKSMGYRIVEYYPTFNGDIHGKLSKILKIKPFDEIILADPNLAKTESIRLLDFCNEHHIDFKYAADLFETQSANVEVRPLAGIPIIEIKKTPLDGWGRIFKRILDLVFSLLFLILFGWLMLIVAIAVKLDSKGPMIFKNERVGEKGKKFNTFKFRSMKSEFSIGPQFEKNKEKALELEEKLIKEKSIKAGPIYKIKDDPRVTRVGNFIRKTSLDEFPQVFNVIKGEMSWVGPRPHQPREVEKYEKRHKQVLNVRPGVTGLAQISGRSDLSFEEEVRLDLYYIENWSLWIDIYILFKTPFILLNKRQAD